MIHFNVKGREVNEFLKFLLQLKMEPSCGIHFKSISSDLTSYKG